MQTTQNTDICTGHRAACTHGPVRTHACTPPHACMHTQVHTHRCTQPPHTHIHPVDVTKVKKIISTYTRIGLSHTQLCSWLMYLEQILIS